MPFIFVPFSAKRIATQIFVKAKLNGSEDFISRVFVCDIILPSKELPGKVSNLSTRIRCESYLILRMSMLTMFIIYDNNNNNNDNNNNKNFI